MPRLVDEPQETSNWKHKSIIFLLTITAVFLYFNHSNRSIFPATDTNMDSDTDSDTSPVPSPDLRTQFGSAHNPRPWLPQQGRDLPPPRRWTRRTGFDGLVQRHREAITLSRKSEAAERNPLVDSC